MGENPEIISEDYLSLSALDIAKPDTILGRPIYTSGYMPRVTTGQKVLVFGDLSHYWIADRASRTFRRLNELYAITDQIGVRPDRALLKVA